MKMLGMKERKELRFAPGPWLLKGKDKADQINSQSHVEKQKGCWCEALGGWGRSFRRGGSGEVSLVQGALLFQKPGEVWGSRVES